MSLCREQAAAGGRQQQRFRGKNLADAGKQGQAGMNAASRQLQENGPVMVRGTEVEACPPVGNVVGVEEGEGKQQRHHHVVAHLRLAQHAAGTNQAAVQVAACAQMGRNGVPAG